MLGYADAMIAGGSEASISALSIAGFSRMKALTKSKDPSLGSRPFDVNRDGFVLAEGAAMLILEDLSTAAKRNVSYRTFLFLSRLLPLSLLLSLAGTNCSRTSGLWFEW